MSNEANTADKKIAGERTVKKKAGRNVVVSPVNVKASGQARVSKELTAPIGLVWNEDTTQTVKKQVKAVKKQSERPAITGTGWPDRPPAPKVNKPAPIQYKPAPVSKPEADKPGNVIASKREETEKAPDVRKETVKKPVKKQPPVREAREPFSSEEKLDALMNSIDGGLRQPAEERKQQGRPLSGQPAKGQSPGTKPQGAGKPVKKGSVLYSPVSQDEARTPISPMQKRPANTQVWEGPIRKVQGYGDPAYGPKFVRTVVTTTTTTYEPVSEDVIRQITSQTSPAALTENVINEHPAISPITGQQAAATHYPGPGRQMPAGQAPVRQNRPGQTMRQQARPVQGGQRPPANRQQAQRPAGQPVRQQVPGGVNARMGGQVPGQQGQPVRSGMPGQNQSITGTIESREPSKPSTGMTQQFAEIEKALGLTNDPGSVDNNPPAAAVINNAGMGNQNGNVPGEPVSPDKPVQGGNPAADTDKSRDYMILFVEGIILIVVLAIAINIFLKISRNKRDMDVSGNETSVEESQPAEENPEDVETEDFETTEAGSEDTLEGEQDILEGESEASGPTEAVPTGSVDVDNDKFTLKCTNVTVKLDTEGNPAALIYFSFKNKTSEQKAAADVFPISVMQNGEPCDTFAALDEYPEEYYNKDMQISDGSELVCAYAVSLKDAVSPITLTVHDNYDTFADVGTTEIALQ